MSFDLLKIADIGSHLKGSTNIDQMTNRELREVVVYMRQTLLNSLVGVRRILTPAQTEKFREAARILMRSTQSARTLYEQGSSGRPNESGDSPVKKQMIQDYARGLDPKVTNITRLLCGQLHDVLNSHGADAPEKAIETLQAGQAPEWTIDILRELQKKRSMQQDIGVK